MARGKYLSLEEARKSGQLNQFAKEHPIDDVHPQAHPEAPGRCPLRRAGDGEPMRLGHGIINWCCEWRCPLTGPHQSIVTNSANSGFDPERTLSNT